MQRMHWNTCGIGDGSMYRSTCGRFVIALHSSKWGYYGMTDTQTGKEYVCRTIDSAKATARNLLSGRYQ